KVEWREVKRRAEPERPPEPAFPTLVSGIHHGVVSDLRARGAMDAATEDADVVADARVGPQANRSARYPHVVTHCAVDDQTAAENGDVASPRALDPPRAAGPLDAVRALPSGQGVTAAEDLDAAIAGVSWGGRPRGGWRRCRSRRTGGGVGPGRGRRVGGRSRQEERAKDRQDG